MATSYLGKTDIVISEDALAYKVEVDNELTRLFYEHAQLIAEEKGVKLVDRRIIDTAIKKTFMDIAESLISEVMGKVLK